MLYFNVECKFLFYVNIIIAICRDGKAKDCYGYGDPLPSHRLCCDFTFNVIGRESKISLVRVSSIGANKSIEVKVECRVRHGATST